MPSRHIDLYRAMYEMDPWGPTRDNIHSAQIASILYNVNRGKSQSPLGWSDFMVGEQPDKSQQDSQQTFERLAARAKPQRK